MASQVQVRVAGAVSAASRQAATATSSCVFAISPTGDSIALAHRRGATELLSVPFNTSERKHLLDGAAGVCALRFDATGERLLSAGDDKIVRLWDVASGKLRMIRSSPEKALLAKASPGAQKASCAAQSSSAAAGSVWRVSSR